MATALVDEAIEFEDPLLWADPLHTPGADLLDPYPQYAQARAAGRIHEGPNQLDPNGPPWYSIFRHADIVECLLNKDLSLVHNVSLFQPTMGDYVMLAMDGAQHMRYRNLVAPAFRPKMLAKWEQGLIIPVVDELIDKFEHEGRADLVRQFDFIFPAQVIARIVGVPREDFRQFQRWAMDMITFTVSKDGDKAKAVAAGQELKDYFAAVLKRRRQEPQDDLISELAHTELQGERLADEEIFSFLRFLLPAGIETTYRSNGSLMFRLLRDFPDQFDAVRADLSLLPRAIEEGLRLEPPFQFSIRSVLQDTQVAGKTVPAGSVVLLFIAAGNRDPEVFDRPDQLDVRRSQGKQLAFSYGAHVCLGMHLARLETRIATQRLIERLPNLRFDHDRAREIDAHIRGVAFRSPTAVPVKWDVA